MVVVRMCVRVTLGAGPVEFVLPEEEGEEDEEFLPVGEEIPVPVGTGGRVSPVPAPVLLGGTMVLGAGAVVFPAEGKGDPEAARRVRTLVGTPVTFCPTTGRARGVILLVLLGAKQVPPAVGQAIIFYSTIQRKQTPVSNLLLHGI